jgi:hypothetical protein
MPKRSIAVLLLITMTLGPAAGAFGEVMDKIRAYKIYMPGKNEIFEYEVQMYQAKVLWFSSKYSEVEEYAAAVENSPHNPMGSNAVFAYSMIGADDIMLTLKDGTEIGLVASAPEYYFTDMVFIQQKYEEALVDLYFYRAESAGAMYEDGNRPAVDEAIAGTYWVAQQNGVTYTEEQIQEKFMEQLDEQIEPILESFISKYEHIFSEIDTYSDRFINSLKNYYLNPCLETFETTIQSAFEFGEESKTNLLSWSVVLTELTRPLSSGLTTSMLSHGDRY